MNKEFPMKKERRMKVGLSLFTNSSKPLPTGKGLGMGRTREYPTFNREFPMKK
jgi:hypothetical protein